MRVKQESVKGSLKFSIKKTKIHDIQSHYFMENRRGKVEAVTDFIFLGSKITVNGDCSPGIISSSLEEKLGQT